MNRLFFVSFAVLAASCIGAALPRSPGGVTASSSAVKSPGTFWRSARDVLLPVAKAGRYRRQSADCANDLAETGEEPYSTCLEELEKLFPGNPDFSLDNVNTYCRNCPTNILNLFSKIERDCSGQAPEQDAVNMIYAACIRDKVGSYCAKDYHDYKTEIGGNHYDNCIADTSKGGGCTPDCQVTIKYLAESMGCCYTELLNFTTNILDRGDTMLGSDVFTFCGSKLPDLCPPP